MKKDPQELESNAVFRGLVKFSGLVIFVIVGLGIIGASLDTIYIEDTEKASRDKEELLKKQEENRKFLCSIGENHRQDFCQK